MMCIHIKYLFLMMCIHILRVFNDVHLYNGAPLNGAPFNGAPFVKKDTFRHYIVTMAGAAEDAERAGGGEGRAEAAGGPGRQGAGPEGGGAGEPGPGRGARGQQRVQVLFLDAFLVLCTYV